MSEQSTKLMNGEKKVNFVEAMRGSQKMKPAESKKDTSQHEDQRKKYCYGKHPPQKYPTYGRKCAKCSHLIHFAKVCKSKTVNSVGESEVYEVKS